MTGLGPSTPPDPGLPPEPTPEQAKQREKLEQAKQPEPTLPTATGSMSTGPAPAGQPATHHGRIRRATGWTGRGARRLSRPTGRWLGLVAVSLAGITLGLLIGGQFTAEVGPFRAHLAVTPSISGGTEIAIPPLGALHLRSHAGPLHLEVRLDALDEAKARAIVTDPDGLARADETVLRDLSAGLRTLGSRSVGAGLLGALVLAGFVYRSMARVALAGGMALLAMAGAGALAAVTFRPAAIQEPRYEGLLANAPAVVGDARRIAGRYAEYRSQLQRLVRNVSRLYGTISALPVYESEDDTGIRVLHISDMHLNPAAWTVVKTIVEQFDIDVVVDTGDLTDWGSEPEASYVSSIAGLQRPYVYVRGNHDSAATTAAVAREPNAIVLDRSVATVAGLTFAGIGDPRFTPDKSTNENSGGADRRRERALLTESGEGLAATILEHQQPVDVAVVHDPASAGPLAFATPLVLAGHLHRREVRRLDGPEGGPTNHRTLLMTEGSTGGAGLRGLEADDPLPLALSVLYFDQYRTLQAYDDIRVGGTGLAQVSLERHLVEPDVDAEPIPEPASEDPGVPTAGDSRSPGAPASGSASGSASAGAPTAGQPGAPAPAGPPG